MVEPAEVNANRFASALDVNNSQLAVPIEAALDSALEALPELIRDALTARS
jgi:hypothetical protein